MCASCGALLVIIWCEKIKPLFDKFSVLTKNSLKKFHYIHVMKLKDRFEKFHLQKPRRNEFW